MLILKTGRGNERRSLRSDDAYGAKANKGFVPLRLFRCGMG